MVQFIDGAMLARMIVHASASLNAEKQKINELNVFPDPDGPKIAANSFSRKLIVTRFRTLRDTPQVL